MTQRRSGIFDSPHIASLPLLLSPSTLPRAPLGGLFVFLPAECQYLLQTRSCNFPIVQNAVRNNELDYRRTRWIFHSPLRPVMLKTVRKWLKPFIIHFMPFSWSYSHYNRKPWNACQQQTAGLVTVEHKTIKNVSLPAVRRLFSGFCLFVDAVCRLPFAPHGHLFSSHFSSNSIFYHLLTAFFHQPKCIKEAENTNHKPQTNQCFGSWMANTINSPIRVWLKPKTFLKDF